MTYYVIAEPCIGIKDMSCIAVCPVDCIHDVGEQLVIDPDDCIGCGACESECPVGAVFSDNALPREWLAYIQLNADLAAARD
jgi:NAD-dependent dihydropyrimidine dehydrogenase PreA subunit